MAIAVVPEPSPDRWARIANLVLGVVVVAVIALFVYSLVDAWLL